MKQQKNGFLTSHICRRVRFFTSPPSPLPRERGELSFVAFVGVFTNNNYFTDVGLCGGFFCLAPKPSPLAEGSKMLIRCLNHSLKNKFKHASRQKSY
jgi:hypothetical protein